MPRPSFPFPPVLCVATARRWSRKKYNEENNENQIEREEDRRRTSEEKQEPEENRWTEEGSVTGAWRKVINHLFLFTNWPPPESEIMRQTGRTNREGAKE